MDIQAPGLLTCQTHSTSQSPPSTEQSAIVATWDNRDTKTCTPAYYVQSDLSTTDSQHPIDLGSLSEALPDTQYLYHSEQIHKRLESAEQEAQTLKKQTLSLTDQLQQKDSELEASKEEIKALTLLVQQKDAELEAQSQEMTELKAENSELKAENSELKASTAEDQALLEKGNKILKEWESTPDQDPLLNH
ncbi:hypothetical protein [Endozoicomonas atrinae]|uniref:hypothetical protein n=1 Tax=Endozoicomonas atrinae TaxID=1333660 RepID=UPI003B00E583